jgi:hypothetical protein
VARRQESDAMRFDPACSLTAGVSGAGSFDGPVPELNPAPATFTTDGSTIRVTIPLGMERSVEILVQRQGSDPTLPEKIQLPQPSLGPDLWRVTIEYSWCNPMECRMEFHADTREPSDALLGAVTLQGKLFSDLSQVGVCLRADDENKRTLFLNVVAYRPSH